MNRRSSGLFFLLLVSALASSCGGGGGGGGSSGGGGGTPPSTLAITTSSLSGGIVGQPYNQALQANGGTTPYVWTVAPGSTIAAGLSLSSAGILTGNPTESKTMTFQVSDSGSPPQVRQRALSLNLRDVLTILDLVPLDPPQLRRTYSGLIRINGAGDASFNWQIKSGSLPTGLSLRDNANNAVTSGVEPVIPVRGTPTAAGSFSFTLQASDNGQPAQTTTKTFTITAIDVPDILTQSPLPLGLINTPYSAAMQWIGGAPPFTWSTNFPLQQGLQLDSQTGAITGIPTESGTRQGIFKVTDSANPPQTGTATIAITVNPALSFTQTTLPDAVLPQDYVHDLPFVGGLPPYSMVLTNGTLPPGLTPLPSGNAGITGIPTTLGTFNFRLKITDAETPPVSVQQDFSIRVNPLLVIQEKNRSLVGGVLGMPYTFQFHATGGLLPLHWEFNGAFPPPDFTLDPVSGFLSGTPSILGFRGIGIRLSDSSSPPQVVLGGGDLQIYDVVKILTTVLPKVASGASLTVPLIGSGGTAHFVWSIQTGSLPTGFSLTSAGSITGQSIQTGQFPFTVRLFDDASQLPDSSISPPSQTVFLPLQLSVAATPGRNDSLATATVLSNTTYSASISPVSDPPTGVVAPDTDYYKISANPGATVTVEITADRLSPPSPWDSFLEFVDASNNRLSVCNNNPANQNGPFTNACANDDLNSGTTDSKLVLQVPSGNSGPLTFYAHVLEWSGNARPDFLYTITVSGAN